MLQNGKIEGLKLLVPIKAGCPTFKGVETFLRPLFNMAKITSPHIKTNYNFVCTPHQHGSNLFSHTPLFVGVKLVVLQCSN